MTPSEQLRKNVGLTFDVVRAAVGDVVAAEEAESLSREGGFVLVDANDPDLAFANEELFETLAARGEQVILVQVNKSISLQTAT